MQKLLNSLYVNDEKAYLTLDGETIRIETGEGEVKQFPLHIFGNIFSFSYAGASPALMGKCTELGINLAFFKPDGRFLCRIDGNKHGNILLRKEQYRISDSKSRSCMIARNFILGKVFNTRWLINRTMRDHALRIDEGKLSEVVRTLADNMDTIREAVDLDTLRGIEGLCASTYFGIFDELIINQKDVFEFEGRSKRPPLDKVNAMLSFGYMLLVNECASALEGVGLDSYAGFLHRDRPGRVSLALDLMEEMRPVLVDRFVLTLINLKQIQERDFVETDSGAVLLTEEGRKKFIKAWQERKKEEIKHPFLQEKINWGLVPNIQAQLLARYLRGDMDDYPPFFWK